MKTERAETGTSKINSGDTVEVYRIGHGFVKATVGWVNRAQGLIQALHSDGAKTFHAVVYS